MQAPLRCQYSMARVKAAWRADDYGIRLRLRQHGWIARESRYSELFASCSSSLRNLVRDGNELKLWMRFDRVEVALTYAPASDKGESEEPIALKSRFH
jgi:hypothetical protein